MDQKEESVRVLFLTWRDTANPEGGGSEVYVQNVASALAAAGHDVTIFCAKYPGSRSLEVVDGVRIVRRGSTVGVHIEAFRYLRRPTFGQPDMIVDVQNGVPFFSRVMNWRAPVVVLVHHVHREQWPIVYGPLMSRIGWGIESRVAPRIYRGSRYITVSEESKRELVSLGVSPGRIHVVHNGTPATALSESPKSAQPTVVVLGRLVPHKRVEHVLEAAAKIRVLVPDLRVEIVGDGWWADRLQERARDLDLMDLVTFHGFVDEATKHRLLCSAWVMALPSLKEGWGIVVMEAASRGVPCVAYREAGGVTESILEGRTGVLADDYEQFVIGLRQLLLDESARERMGESAREHSSHFSMGESARKFAEVLHAVNASTGDGRRIAVDPLDVVVLRHEAAGKPADQEKFNSGHDTSVS